MVFREQTIVQVRSLVESLEKNSTKTNWMIENENVRASASSAQEKTTKSKLPNTRHARSCLASGLFHAVYKCRLRKVKFLLDTGLNINSRNDYGYSVLVAALHIETDSKQRKMFELLLENDADPFQKDPKYKRNALLWAAVLGRDEQVELLIDTYLGEFDMHDKDRDGMTALHLATQAGHTDVVKCIVREMARYGTSVDVPDNLGLTPFLHAKRLGYGLIADVLKVEGGACSGQGDTFSFKKADEWRDIGIQERNELVRKRRQGQYEQAAISGSARMLMEFEGPGYEIINIPSPKSRKRIKDVGKSSSFDNDDKDTKSVRIISPKSNASMPSGMDGNSYRKRHVSSSVDSPGTGRLDPMSLIQMSAPRKGVSPIHFRPSQIDDSKAEQYKHVIGDLTTMMDYLSLQHTKSFRHSVPPIKPKHDQPVSGEKRSTLAMLFGRNKKGRKTIGKKASGKTSSAKKEKRSCKSK